MASLICCTALSFSVHTYVYFALYQMIPPYTVIAILSPNIITFFPAWVVLCSATLARASAPHPPGPPPSNLDSPPAPASTLDFDQKHQPMRTRVPNQPTYATISPQIHRPSAQTLSASNADGRVCPTKQPKAQCRPIPPSRIQPH